MQLIMSLDLMLKAYPVSVHSKKLKTESEEKMLTDSLKYSYSYKKLSSLLSMTE